ncbi:hypothetical protein SCORR_v1c01050 [Spiroplasma corruscae]|uniref:Transmembrane protein n=1 Tax=Spiroplasma corruscae TaxID=216934 RepID=A0A222EMY6_9MOLU|nr:hypothetical protein [Spiroplasma corruscae]ASP27880.1 hypothetical protein SCORR_v1c01050 [Spiroplasma corruscae]
MNGNILAISIGLISVFLFMFYTSGLVFAEFFKLKIKNNFSAIAMGFFSYFTYVSILTFPLQLISLLPYVFFIYFILAINILYLIFCFIFIRFWLDTTFIKLDFLIFLFVAIIFVVLNFYFYDSSNDKSFQRHKSTLSILYWLKDNPVSFFSNSTLFNFLEFKAFQGWFTFQLSLIMMVNINAYEYETLLKPFLFLLDGFLYASIFFCLVDSLSDMEKKRYKIMTLISCLVVSVLAKFITRLTNYDFWNGEIIFAYLIIYSTILLIRYTSFNKRERFLPIFIGLIMGGYTSFSWSNSYHVLFLLYAFLFIVQKSYSKNFTKDILKLSILPISNIAFYNLVSKLYFQFAIFILLVLFLLVLSLIMTKKYSITHKFELFVEEKTIFTILIVPVLFLTFSTALILSVNKGFMSQEDNYLNFLYVWTSFISDYLLRYWITLILSLSTMGAGFVWIVFRKKFKYNLLVNIIDLLFICYLTFYNPIVIKFLNVIYPKVTALKGIVMICLFLVLINSLPIYLFNKIDSIKKVDSIIVIKKYNRFKL